MSDIIESIAINLNDQIASANDMFHSASVVKIFTDAGGELERDGNCWSAISSKNMGPNACCGYSEKSRLKAIHNWFDKFCGEPPSIPIGEIRDSSK